MNTKHARLGSTGLLVCLLAFFAGGVHQASAASVTPIFVAGNPTCVDLGYDFGFKVDPPNAGTYNIDGFNTVTVTTDGVYFDWSSTLGMDAVIAKGGPNANVYIYDPPAESFGDTVLHSPINPNNGQPFGLSHIEFCFDYELTASKTASTTYSRTYTWAISKTVDDDSHIGFTGDSFTSNYDVVVDQTVTDSNFAVNGTITVNNPTPFTVSFSVTDSVGGNPATVVCPTNSLSAGASTICTYSASLGSKTDGTNTATITSNTTGVGGASASANYAFGNPTTTVGYPTVTVTDSLGGALGTASGDQTFEYPINFSCDEDEGVNPNTATILETGQTANASVTVTCYELVVTKDADTSLTRTWNWTINKVGDESQLTLSTGQSFLVNYQVTVSATSTDSNHAVSGTVSVNNPAPINAILNAVSDMVSGVGAATVDCGVTFPYTLVAGGTLNCTYSASLPNADNRLNTATATLQNTPSGTTDFTGSANVSFANADVSQVDECITVNDDQFGALGTVCANASPQIFNYSLNVGPYATCGEYTYVNTATFTTTDTGTTGSDSHTVNVNVPCAAGCTLTPGYWKTHSLHGPAPYDDAWLAIGPAGADTTFFWSFQSYYQVLWTAPQGNAYYILAHAYIAAKLNILNGASTTPEVDAAILYAEDFFSTHFPWLPLSKSARNTAIKNAQILDNYNNGLIGPGHCSE